MHKFPKLKRNPFNITKDVSRIASLENEPVWLKGIQRIPPAPKPQDSLILPNTLQFQSAELSVQNRWKKQLSLAASTKRNAALKRGKPLYVRTPPRIVYAEDEIRNVFYTQHPFELHRPRSLAFVGEQANLEWTSIHGSETVTVPLSGESVVQRTMYLVQKGTPDNGGKPLDVNAAYPIALHEFYQARKAQELKEKAARALAYETGLKLWHEEQKRLEMERAEEQGPDYAKTPGAAKPAEPTFVFGRPLTASFLEAERKELQEGLSYRRQVLSSQQMSGKGK
ncbi:mitochondrial ribosomal small subunit component [Kappamyces sp. JEL0680]|nr:mitochondrial ribosomal small subunit component [Kappamyces sp. JEL0680]